MKKALLILSILLSAVLVWYFYTIEDFKNKAIAHEEIEDYQRALEYYKEYAELTNDNVEYVKKLIEIASIQIKDKDYYNAEVNLDKYKNINLSGGWVFSSVDSAKVNMHNLIKNRLPEEYIEIYENTGRLEKALEYYLTNKEDLITHSCMNCYWEDLNIYVNKTFNLCYKLNKLDTSFYIYLDNIYSMATIQNVDAIEDVIQHKISKYKNSQKDSILKAIFDSYEVSISANKDHNSFKTSIELFGRRIPDPSEPRPRRTLDSNINIKDTTYIISKEWDRFKNTKLYQILAERK
ncbi:MAG: hypothetical protein CVV25_02870 [Ignavibacteriae bacterium HGW-Ignavibacteriae-4]|jgi:uncharacterized protein (UPF0333 family)|nr:MAG: hypothetical protein CVV25_02870 [Ignavibacteriae bacterium HGW-Ignavibacteriae-4]